VASALVPDFSVTSFTSDRVKMQMGQVIQRRINRVVLPRAFPFAVKMNILWKNLPPCPALAYGL